MPAKKNIFWIKNKLFRPAAISAYSQALANENCTTDQLCTLNWAKRRAIVAYAYQHSPFYREFYDANGFSPKELESPEEWASIPILEKDHLKKFTDEILAVDVPQRRRIHTTTGGSTGAPVLTYRDKGFPEEILKWRMLKRWSAEPFSDMLMLWRIPKRTKTFYARLVNKLIWLPTKRYKFDVSMISRASLLKIEDILLKNRPKIIWGYVGALEELANYLKEREIRLDYAPLVWATASPMSEVQLTLFHYVFGPRVLDQYACSEIHWIASNAPNTRHLQIEYDYRHVEVVDALNGHVKNRGTTGDLLITDLENRAFPLIRYRNGDRSSILPQSADVSTGLPWISPVKGRVTDTLKSPSGRKVPGEYVTTIFDDAHGLIRQFSVLQKRDFTIEITVSLSLEGRQSAGTVGQVLSRVKDNLGHKLGDEVVVAVKVVDKLPHDRGKIRFIRSELAETDTVDM